MTLPATLAETLDRTLDAEAAGLRELALKIHAHPELRFEEHRAAGWISDLLTHRGHGVERPLGGLPPALRARAGLSGPRLALLAEHDARP